MSEKPTRKISVILCTYNRCDSLRRTLESLRQAAVSVDLEWELLVIDNNSTDGTRAAVAEFAQTSQLDVRCLTERRRGKAFALNLGIAAAAGEILAFLDDDILPRQDWLQAVDREFGNDNDLAVLTGQIALWDRDDLPISICQHPERAEIRSYDGLRLCNGCNFAARVEAFGRIGPFDIRLGPGTGFLAAEDWDVFYRFWKGGLKMVYEPSVFVYHNHGRRTPREEVQIRRAYAVGYGAFSAKHILRGDRFVLQRFYWALDDGIRSWMRGTGKFGARYPLWLLRGSIGYAFSRALHWPRSRENLPPKGLLI
jgi:glycosyltransferase involved in cell wall biosynthesis